MLISIILTLVSDSDALLPAHLGRANYAATLRALHALDPALASVVHDADGPKALTCSSLLDAPVSRNGTHIRAGTPYTVRVTGLIATVTQRLDEALLHQTPATWQLDGHTFAVQKASADAADHGWAGRTTYAQLAAAQMDSDPQAMRKVVLEFAAPVAFKSAGITVPVPLPGLVFGSLVERWNTFSPITVMPEMRRFGEERIAISNYRLESRAIEQKNAALRIGGVGRVTYTALGADRYWLGMMQMLAAFALYSGVGVQTATGMGQTRQSSQRAPRGRE